MPISMDCEREINFAFYSIHLRYCRTRKFMRWSDVWWNLSENIDSSVCVMMCHVQMLSRTIEYLHPLQLLHSPILAVNDSNH